MILNNLLSMLDEVRAGLTLLVLHLLGQLFLPLVLLLTLLQKLLLLGCLLGMDDLVLTGLLSLTNSGGL